MRPSVRARPLACGALLLALAACDAASGVEVQPLPPADRPSAEARAGLPEVEGAWHFAGWELPTAAALEAASSSLMRPGDFLLQHQRLDSIAGSYVEGGVRFPVVGEVRRDRRIALVALAADDQSRYAAGEVLRDTLWVELTSLSAAESWPVGTRAAWVRGAPAAPFLRLPGVPVARDTVDTLAAPLPTPGMPGETTPPSAAHPAAPPVRTPIGQPVEQPTPAAPRPAPDTARVPAPPVQQPTSTPRVLGVPVRPEPRPAEPRPITPRPLPPPAMPLDTIVAPPRPEPGAR